MDRLCDRQLDQSLKRLKEDANVIIHVMFLNIQTRMNTKMGVGQGPKKYYKIRIKKDVGVSNQNTQECLFQQSCNG